MSKHLPYTATAVREDRNAKLQFDQEKSKAVPMFGCSVGRTKPLRGSVSYRKRVIGTVEECPDADSVRRSVASLIERINAPELAFARPRFQRFAAISNDASWRKETPGAATPRRNAMRDI
jgi:hypothetical protein